MRILMLSWEYPPRIVGGISRVVYGLAQKLGQQGNELHVVTCWEPGSENVEKDGYVYVHRIHMNEINAIDFTHWVMHLNFVFIQESVKLINELGKFDLIHAHDWIVAYAAKTLKHAYTIPLISTIHATEFGRNGGIHNNIQRYINDIEWWLSYESWKIIVNSAYMEREVQNIFQLPDDKIRIIPNGVDEDKFNGVERDEDFRKLYALENEKIIFYVGRIVNEKGVHLLIEALPKVIQYYNDVKLVIAGKGPQLEYLRSQSENAGIASKVYFTGYISDSDLSKLYKCADIAVFPSLYEPFGIVALEGIVANVPIVVSDTGGLGEIVEHGVDGLKFYNGNANSLADCILEILYNPVNAEIMKSRAWEKVRKLYNWDVISNQTMDVYREVIAKAGKSDWKAKSFKELFNMN